MTETSAPTPENLNVLQLLELARNIIWVLSPRISEGIRQLMVDLVQAVDDDEALLRNRVTVSPLSNHPIGEQVASELGSNPDHAA